MKRKKIIILSILFLTLTGCTKNLKDGKTIVQNPETGQSLVQNILCQPENETTINIYKEHNVDLEKLPSCKEYKISSNGYEGLWTTLFVKPLALLIIKLGELVKNYGLAVIILTLIIRTVIYPLTKKTAMQSENMKKAKPKLDKLEKKYAGKTDQESMMQKSQEMMLIYKQNNINPLSGCLFSLIQIPLFFAFFEALNRLPVIFEETFLGFQLGTSPLTALKNGHPLYLIFVILVTLTTFFSFKLNQTASMSKEQEGQMKMMMNISVVFISIASFTMSTGIQLYWIVTNAFTVVQNLLVKRRSKNANVI
ncbi:MAG: YidC/Oxa1 family membrane protein insertase [Bacilli bacterium]|nr:YidC/Oxa1 family membrane protein insertase [Bacilli bacterium]